MKAYVGVTGAIFAIVTLLHLARTPEILSEFKTDPVGAIGYWLLTLLTAALAVWAYRLFSRLRRGASVSPAASG
jgi:hypothetical protein